MADEPTTEDSPEPEKKRRRMRSEESPDAESNPSRSNPANSAGLASCLTGLILLLLLAGTLIYVWWTDEPLLPAGMSWWPWRLPLVIFLIIIIPIVVYRAVTLWLMGEGPRFVDLEFSWRAGIDAMAEQGINLRSAPLFLIIGGGSEKLRKNFMAAAGIPFRVNGVPDVPAPLHWYAADNAIYLYLDDATWMNLTARQYRAASRARRGRQGPAIPSRDRGPAQQGPAVNTLVPGQAQPIQEPPVAGDLTGTQLPSDHSEGPVSDRPKQPRRRPAAYIGTVGPEHVAAPTQSASTPASKQPAAARRARPVASEESSLQLRRLEAICTKLRNQRQPLCPINGILTLFPFDLLQASRHEIEEVERAISADLATAQRELQIRCPVTALVVAMEQERGFCELIRRIGKEHAARQRFGQRFDLRREPSMDELRRFSTYVSGVFEDWVYTLFREDEVLSHPGNPALYNLLCKVRRSFQARLSDVLTKGFGFDPDVDEDPLLFSGCYFAATGAQPERQAFVSGILSKLREEQEDLQWTDAALEADARRRKFTVAGWAVTALLAVAVVLTWQIL